MRALLALGWALFGCLSTLSFQTIAERSDAIWTATSPLLLVVPAVLYFVTLVTLSVLSQR
jgi:hypothetical protein